MILATLLSQAEFALEVRKSRFLARARPLPSVAEALEAVSDLGDASATHNCWAFRVGATYRSSDDGEPAGTAGRPILAAIDQQGFDQVLVVVTRWYGGINLGAGGLARAYGGSAAECLRNAPSRPLLEMAEAILACDFALANAVHGLLREAGAEKLGESFDEQGLRLRLRLPASMVMGLARRLGDLSRGAATLQRVENASE